MRTNWAFINREQHLYIEAEDEGTNPSTILAADRAICTFKSLPCENGFIKLGSLMKNVEENFPTNSKSNKKAVRS